MTNGGVQKIAVALALPALLTGCSGWQSALDAHGASATSLKQLIVLIVSVCSIVWALVMVALILAVFRRRERNQTVIQPNAATERRMTTAVVSAVAATVVIISFFTVASFFTTRALGVAGGDDLTIKVRGLQWWWGLEYFGSDPDRRFESANEIHIPVGRNVRLQLEGLDVIHSFWVPSLAGKQDLIPGRPNELTIRAERAGVYRGQCAEFCGLQHAHMAFLVVAEEPAAFDAWARLQRENAAASFRGGNRRRQAGVSREALRGLPCRSRNAGGRQDRARSHPCGRPKIHRRRTV